MGKARVLLALAVGAGIVSSMWLPKPRFVGMTFVVVGLGGLVNAVLLGLGKVQKSRMWGYSALAQSLIAVSLLIWGLHHLFESLHLGGFVLLVVLVLLVTGTVIEWRRRSLVQAFCLGTAWSI